MGKNIFKLELYQFQKLSAFLDQLGYPKISFNSGFQVVKGVDFEKAFKAGNIRFEEDGIYLDYDEKSMKGYMFIREPWITDYGKYPKFHIVKCKTIQDFIFAGNFNIRYDFSNSEMNDLIDKTTRALYKDEILELCSNCKRQVNSEIDTTLDFFDLLSDEYKVEDVQIDLFGYTQDWEKISRAYRGLKNYTCEDCGLEIEKALDRRFVHVHHISGDKTDNSIDNLKCLCIFCHSNQDELHRQNFSKDGKKKDLDIFLSKYKSDLIALGNKYLRIKSL
jgi:hypothetical protein